jgi:dTDP-glucose 4,6-dehydratase
VLITGGAGFIGHHLIEAILKNTDWEVVTLDRLDYSGDLGRLSEISAWPQARHRVRFVWHDLRAGINPTVARRIGGVELVLHLAAATHVDRSIEDPMGFVQDNVVGTTNLLLWARDARPAQFLYFSTDEVFGPAPNGRSYAEWDRYRSANPYAATKAGAEELCLAFQNTYGLPIAITHTMNVFGERQSPEKFIPSTVRKVRDGETVQIHADATRTISGSRFYIHARNVAAAMMFLHQRALPGEKYNIVGEREVSNLELAQLIAATVGRDLKYEMVSWHASRPGHDLRYALDGSRLAAMGWRQPVDFEESLRRTIQWTLEHPEWL